MIYTEFLNIYKLEIAEESGVSLHTQKPVPKYIS